MCTFHQLFCMLIFVTISKSLEYPNVWRNESFVELVHGTQVPDPYRWLEDLDSLETAKFVEEQQITSQKYLSSLKNREEIKNYLSSLVDYERWGVPRRKGNWITYFHNTGLQEEDTFRLDEGTLLLDPTTLSDDGSISVSPWYQIYSKNGSLFVHALANKGSDWLEGKILKVPSGEIMQDLLKFIKWPDFSFDKETNGLFYSRFPLNEEGVPLSIAQIHYHRLGTSQDEDFFVHENTNNPLWFLFSQVSNDGEFLIIKEQPDYVSISIKVASLSQFNKERTHESLPRNFTPVFLAEEHKAMFKYITNNGNRFFFLSNHNAPNYRVIYVEINLDNDSNPVSEPQVLIKEDPKNILKWVEVVGSSFLLMGYMVDVKHQIEVRHLQNGSVFQTINFPIEGVVKDYSVSTNIPEFFILLENIVHPGAILKCEISTQVDCEVWKEMKLKGIQPENFIMEQFFVNSKDETPIPLFIGRNKSLEKNGETPALLYGYGGFTVDVLPTFNPLIFGFISYFGGIYASTNIRGGGEYGETWHASGTILNKQNSFDDFISVSEWLASEKYTSPSRLAIQGSSNGGLLVGACINQRPDLYGFGFPDVGLMDMLRFQLSSIGETWCAEYGCPKEEVHFRNLFSYSPLHNVKGNVTNFPALLVTTASHDYRVQPYHSYKYAATLQHVHGKKERPILLKVIPNAGHSEGKPLSVQIEDYTDYYAFYKGVIDGEKENNDSGAIGLFQNSKLFFIVLGLVFVLGNFFNF